MHNTETANAHRFFMARFELERKIEALVNEFEKFHSEWSIEEIIIRKPSVMITPLMKKTVKIKASKQ